MEGFAIREARRHPDHAEAVQGVHREAPAALRRARWSEVACAGAYLPAAGHPPSTSTRTSCAKPKNVGYTDAWSAEVDFNDAFTPMAAMAAWTKTTRLGSAIGSIYTRTPTLLARDRGRSRDIAPGRIVFGIGTSSPAIVERWNGVKLEEPLKRMRETVAFMKHGADRREDGDDRRPVRRSTASGSAARRDAADLRRRPPREA